MVYIYIYIVQIFLSLIDIHKAADMIGDICDLSVDQIRLNLLDKWLSATHQEDADIVSNVSISALLICI